MTLRRQRCFWFLIALAQVVSVDNYNYKPGQGGDYAVECGTLFCVCVKSQDTIRMCQLSVTTLR